MNTKQVGDESEATFLAALVAAGYSVSVPFGDNDPYDLVVDADGRLYRLQVKTGWREGSCVRFKTASKTTVGGDATSRSYSADEVDAFGVRCRDTGRLYWVPVEVAASKNTYLRVDDAAIDHPAINWAADYEFDGTIPRAGP